MAHTPGPWFVDQDMREGMEWNNHIYGSNGDCVCFMAHDGNDPSNAIGLANARLIAAAPDLLEALTDMLSGWRYIRATHGDLYGVGWDRAEEKANAAIAKATEA
jgi:hypothetical protein